MTEADLRNAAAQSGCMYGELCGGIGYIGFDLPQEHPQFGQSFPCQCRAAELNARRLLHLFDDAEVPPLYRGLGFDTFERLPNLDGKTKALDAARAMADRAYFKHRHGLDLGGDVRPGLTLFGPVGAGKSGLSVAILRAWAEAGAVALWITWQHLINKIQATYNNDPRVNGAATHTREQLIEGAQRVELLVIDDFGDVERWRATDDRRDIAYEILNYRHQRDLATVVTTNLPLNEHADKAYFGKRISRRWIELTHYVVCGGVDIQRDARRNGRSVDRAACAKESDSKVQETEISLSDTATIGVAPAAPGRLLPRQ
jgi:DNA replication protein DnaC